MAWSSRRLRVRQLVYSVFVAAPQRQWFPLDLSKAAQLSVANTTLMLARMEDEGLLKSDFDPGAYPRRRWYQATDEGLEHMRGLILSQEK